MKLPRFSIAGLMVLVLFVGVGVAGLRAADDSWDGGLLGLDLLVLLTAVLIAVHRTGRRRAYWLGFALFGWAYLVAALVPPVESRLPTTKGLAFLDSKVLGRPREVTFTVALGGPAGPNTFGGLAFSPQGNVSTASSQAGVRLWDATTGRLLAGTGGTTENFVRIGHSLLALVMAFAEAHLSRLLYDRGRNRSADDTGRSAPKDSFDSVLPAA